METIETFKPVYQAFLESNLSVRDFCKQIGMPEGRFYYWQKRIRSAAAKSTGEFLPVSINNCAGKVVLMGNQRHQVSNHQSIQQSSSCEILFPNGVAVRFAGDVSASTIGELIMMSRQ